MQEYFSRQNGSTSRRILKIDTKLACWMYLAFCTMCPLTANASDDHVCDRSARSAAIEVGIPVNVLLAIARTETGRQRNGQLWPWPWTVNMEGKGVWFESKEKAREYAQKHYDNGARSFDVGCFQLNHRWHGKHFGNLNEMFDPLENARYAAEFLSRLYAEFGSWTEAASAYHSRTPEFAQKYANRFNRILASLPKSIYPNKSQSILADLTVDPASNSFPLLTSRSKPNLLGSLVPITASRITPIIDVDS
ncbi:lytic transglycosylase domain-containing protein [Shimia sp.]|uniref:lytic transglycosylase domain-containing protein n=1 Tax=Shimia sp. TaxID=1954381 RepID=UPI00329A0294